MFVKVIPVFADRLEKGCAADAKIEVAASDSAFDAQSLSPETTTQPAARWYRCTGDATVMAMARVVGFWCVDLVDNRVFVRALCRRRSRPCGVNVPMREVPEELLHTQGRQLLAPVEVILRYTQRDLR